MPTNEWVQVKADPKTCDEADEIARMLSDAGPVHFTKAQVLSAGLAFGVQAIKGDPTILVPKRSRKK